MNVTLAKNHVAAAQRALVDLPGSALVTIARVHLNSALTALTALGLGATGPVANGDTSEGLPRDKRPVVGNNFFGQGVNLPGSMNGCMGS